MLAAWQSKPSCPQMLTLTPFVNIGKPFVRQPRGDSRVTPEDKRRAVAQRAAEVAERRAAFDANNSKWKAKVVHWQPLHTQARHTNANSFCGF